MPAWYAYAMGAAALAAVMAGGLVAAVIVLRIPLPTLQEHRASHT